MTMFLEKNRCDGLAHLSYIIRHGGQAAVIDPRRDCEIYSEIASRNGAAIIHIFETYRNEDYVSGSTELARRTGAEIYHGQALDFKYGTPVSNGDTFQLGDLILRVIETPGRTDFYPDQADEVAVLLYDSIFDKLLPLGDHVILLPAHAAGSVCGSGMAEGSLPPWASSGCFS